VAGWWFSPVSSTNKIDLHDITEILLKVVLNTIALTLLQNIGQVDFDHFAIHFIRHDSLKTRYNFFS
jgi:hypothetical protein